MPNEWETIHVVRLSESRAVQGNYDVARIVTIGGTALMLDIREMLYNSPTRNGVSFHLPEVKWISKLLNDIGEGSLYLPHRSITLTKLWYGLRLMVEKKNCRQEILLSLEALENFKLALPALIEEMEKTAKMHNMPVLFKDGDIVNELFPEIIKNKSVSESVMKIE